MPDGMPPEIPAGTPVVDATKNAEPSDGDSKVPLEPGSAEGTDVVDLGDLGPPNVAIDFEVVPDLQPGETADAAPVDLSVGSYSPDTDLTIGSYVPAEDVARAEIAVPENTGPAGEPLASEIPAIDAPPAEENAAPVDADVAALDTPPVETVFDELGSAHPEMPVPAAAAVEAPAEKPVVAEPELPVAEESPAEVVSEDAAPAETEVVAADAFPGAAAPGVPDVSAPDETPAAAEEPETVEPEVPVEAEIPAETVLEDAAPVEIDVAAADASPGAAAPGDPEVSAPDESPVAPVSEDVAPGDPDAPTPDQPPLDAAPEDTDVADEPDAQDAATEGSQSTEDEGTVAAGDEAKTGDAEVDHQIDGPVGSDAEIADLASAPSENDVDTSEHRQTEDDRSDIDTENDVSVEIDTLENDVQSQSEEQNEDAPDVGPSGGSIEDDEKIEMAGDDGHGGPIVFGVDDGRSALPAGSAVGNWDDFMQFDGVDSAADAGNQTLTLENGDVVSRDGDGVTLDGDSSATVTFSQVDVLTFEEAKSADR